MALPLNEEQIQLRETMRGWFTDSYPLSVVRAVFEGKREPLTLSELAELGLSEAFTFDSNGWGVRELGIVAFESGYALAPTAVYLALLKGKLTDSPLHFAFDDGRQTIEFGTNSQQAQIDRTQYFAVSTASELRKTNTLTSQALIANEAAGVCARVIAMTSEYVTTRKQFGKAIGTFQAVQHKLAELFVLSEALRTTAEFAAWSGSHSPDQFALSSTAARTLASEVTPKVVEGCIQLHGGIGFTYEHDLHLFLRRAKVLGTILKGDIDTTSLLLSEGRAVAD